MPSERLARRLQTPPSDRTMKFWNGEQRARPTARFGTVARPTPFDIQRAICSTTDQVPVAETALARRYLWPRNINAVSIEA